VFAYVISAFVYNVHHDEQLYGNKINTYDKKKLRYFKHQAKNSLPA
jgi:hypothetical protein